MPERESARGQQVLNRMYRFRWPLAIGVLLTCFGLMAVSMVHIITFSKQVDSLMDPPPKALQPKVFDSRLELWFDRADPALKAYNDVEDTFIPEDIVLIAFQEKDDPWGVFGERSLETIDRITKGIKKIPYVRNVRSLTSAPWIRWGEAGPGEQGLLVTDLFENAPKTYSRDERLKRMIAVLGAHRAAKLAGEKEVRRVLGPDASFDDYIGEPRFINGIISEDGRTAALQVKVLRDKLSPEVIDETFGDHPTSRAVGPKMHANLAQWRALDGIEKVLKGESYTFHVTGLPSWQRNFNDVGQADMMWVGVLFVVLSLVLFLLYRRKSAVIIPVLVVLSSVMGMNGAIFLFGDLINNITSLCPMIVTAVGIGDAVHMVTTYYLLKPGYTDKRALIQTVIRRTALPVFLTSITTAVGFFSLCTSSILPLTQFGYTGGLGVMIAYIVSMTAVPALLSLIPVKAKRVTTEQMLPSEDLATPYWTDTLVNFTVKRRRAIIGVSLVILAVAGYGAARLELNVDFRDWFPDDNPVISDVHWVENHIGGVGDVEIIFSGPPAPKDEGKVRARQARIEELEVRQLRSQGAKPGDGAATPAGDDDATPADDDATPAGDDATTADDDAAPADDDATPADDDLGSRPAPPPPLSAKEKAELAQLEKEEAAYQRGRIAVSAEFLRSVSKFEKRLRQEMQDPDSPISKFRKLNSGLDVLKKINQVQHENRASYYRVPSDNDVPAEARAPSLGYDEVAEEYYLVPGQDASSLAAQYYIQYENGAKPPENLSSLISVDRRTFRLAVRIDQARSHTHVKAFNKVRDILHKEFPELIGTPEQVKSGKALASMEMTGKAYLFSTSIDEFGANLLRSLSIALVVIVVLIMLIYRSVRLGLVSIIPNLLPLAIPLAFFGVFNMILDAAVVVVASIALGVAVDDTIHLMTKFKEAREKGLDAHGALTVALRKTGTAMTFTSIVLVAGFGVMTFADFHPNIMIGKLASIMIALAWIADMILTPALLSFFGGGAPLQSVVPILPKASVVGDPEASEGPSRSGSAAVSASPGSDFHTVVIGAGQFGLAAGFFLSRAGVDYTILEAGSRVGDSWRNRWDSLKLFTPTVYNSLPGLPFLTGGNEDWYRPTKDETADYFEKYANELQLPIQFDSRVARLTREDGRYVITTQDDRQVRADNVIVTTGFFTEPFTPPFAKDLDPSITQLHATEYRNPSQLSDGDVLVVGAGASGCEIAMELVKTRRAYLSGRSVGKIPRRVLGLHVFWLFPFISSRPKTGFIGKKMHAAVLNGGWPLVRFNYKTVTKTGVERVPRVKGVVDGAPVLENGESVEVSNVIWCTGFQPNFSWIDVPLEVGKDGSPIQDRGIVEGTPGIYFVGQPFQHSESSTLIHGTARDAKYVVEDLLRRDESDD